MSKLSNDIKREKKGKKREEMGKKVGINREETNSTLARNREYSNGNRALLRGTIR